MIWEHAVAENAWQLAEGIYRILLPLPWAVPFVNVYLLASQDEYVLVDCGADWLPSLRALGRALKAIGVPAGGLSAVLLTHQHPDHAGGAAPVQERWGGTVLVHPRERHLRPPTAPALRSWLAEHGVDPAVAERAAAARDRTEALPRRVEDLAIDRPFVVGDLAFEVSVVAGHSPGQVILREPNRGWLLTADHVIPVHAANVWAFPGDEGDPFGDYLIDLERTLDLDASLILPGHGLPWRGSVREATWAMLAYHREFLERVRGLVGERRRSAWEIARALRPDVPADPVGIRFSLAEVLAALNHLARRGEILRAADGRWEVPEAGPGRARPAGGEA